MGILLTAMLLAVGSASAHGAAMTYTVPPPSGSTTSGDDNPAVPCSGTVCGTLRDAIAAANANPGSTIELTSGVTYQLTEDIGVPDIQASMTITGDGTPIIEQTVAKRRVLNTEMGTTVAISGVTITGGQFRGANGTGGGAGGDGDGGGINNLGNLTLTDDAITNDAVFGGNGGPTGNTNGGAGSGGGVYNGGSLTLDDDTFSGDNASGGISGGTGTGGEGQGGDVYNAGAGSLTIVDSAISYGSAYPGAPASTTGAYGSSEGGGLRTYGPATITDSTFAEDSSDGGVAGNNLYGGAGGGIDSSEPLTITGSTLGPDDFAAGTAGGISTAGGTIVNSTIYGNQAGDLAGGLYTEGTVNTTLASDTITNNSASAEGGGNIGAGAQVTLENTLINAGSAGTAGQENCAAYSAMFVDGGHNFESDTASQCGLSAAAADVLSANQTTVSASPSDASGGPTPTLALVAGAPEIGAGGACTDPTASNAALVVDQRGLPRPAAGPCDIGAFQTQLPANTAAPAVTPSSGQVGVKLSCSQGTWTSGDGTSTFTYQWLRGGTAISGATASTYTTTGADGGQTLSCRVTATATYGSVSATSGAVQITPAATTTTTTQTTTTPGSTLPALVISNAGVSAKRWREHKGKGKIPVGTTLHYTLNRAATVLITFTRQVKGRKVGAKCAAPTTRNKKKRACTRTINAGTLIASGQAGVNTYHFTGKVRKLLPAGRYTATISASGAVPAKVTFTIVKS